MLYQSEFRESNSRNTGASIRYFLCSGLSLWCPWFRDKRSTYFGCFHHQTPSRNGTSSSTNHLLKLIF